MAALRGLGWHRPVGAAVLVVAYVVAAHLLPGGIPAGIALLGIVFGLLNGLAAVGLVLVFRAGNYVNFAQGSIGAAAATLTFRLIQVEHWEWYSAAVLGLVTGILLSALLEILFVQRLYHASRLILTVATIGIGQFAVFVGLIFTSLITSKSALYSQIGAAPQPPFPWQFTIGLAHFGGGAVLTLLLCPLLLLGLALYLRRSPYGAVVEAAAQNPDRARLLGVSVRSLSTLVWALVGGLVAVAAILETSVVGVTLGGATSGPDFLLLSLAPAVIAGLASLPGAVVAALVLGVVQSVAGFSLPTASWIDLILFLALTLGLLARRQLRGRAAAAEERAFAIQAAVRAVPRELRARWGVRAGRRATQLAVLALVVLVPAGLSLSDQFLAGVLVVYVLAGLSITVLTGMAGQVSLGQWAFVGFGGLLGGYLASTYHMGFLEGLILVPLAGAGAAAVIGLAALRIRGIMLGAVTLAFAVAAADLIFQEPPFTFSAILTRPVIFGINLAGQLSYYYFCLIVLLLAILGVRNLQRSDIGRSMLAARDNDRAAAAYGISPVRARLTAFALAGLLAALAGYLYVYSATSLDATSFPALTSLLLFAAVVIGGVGSITGGILGGLLFRGVIFFLPSYAQFLATSLGLLIVLLFLPGGVASGLFGLRDAWLRGYARKRGIVVPSLLADTVDAAGTAGAAGVSDRLGADSAQPARGARRPAAPALEEVTVAVAGEAGGRGRTR